MANKENFNPESIKYNKTTLFLTKFIFNGSISLLKKSGFIDSYIGDINVDKSLISDDKNARLIYLLFRNSKNLDLSDLIKNISTDIKIVTTYEVINDYRIVIIEFPKKFEKDYDYIISGRYSKLSDDFKSVFPITKDVFNSEKKKIGKEYTIYYHIFNKTDWLKDIWLKRLNLVELDENLELWDKPTNEKDLIFDIKNII